MTPEQLDELERLARAALPSANAPWTTEGGMSIRDNYGCAVGIVTTNKPYLRELVALCDPASILELVAAARELILLRDDNANSYLSRAEAAEKERDELRARLEARVSL